MKQKLLVFLLVLAVLAAGVLAGIWIERQRPVPPPPAKLMAELVVPATKLQPARQARLLKLRPAVNRAELTEAIATLKPRIEAYRKKVAVIDEDFETAMTRLLSPEQQAAYTAARAKITDRQAQQARIDPAPPLDTDAILALQNRPAYSVVNMVVIDLKLDWLTRELNLAPAQVGEVRRLLQERREKFIALVDATPPPSLMLSDLATVAQRLAEPDEPPADGK